MSRRKYELNMIMILFFLQGEESSFVNDQNE